MASTHEYPVTVQWEGGRDGKGTVTGNRTNTQNSISVPPEFQGSNHPGTNPEELLTSAIASCYAITFGIIAQNRKLPVKDLKVEATGYVEQNGAQFTYTGIRVRPTITVDAGIDEAQLQLVEDMAHKADLYCIITNAVRDKVKIEVEPDIVKA